MRRRIALLWLVGLLAAAGCRAPAGTAGGSSAVASMAPSGATGTASTSPACALRLFPEVVDPDGPAIVAGRGFGAEADITLTVVEKGKAFTADDLSSLHTDGEGAFRQLFVPETADAGRSLTWRATDGSCSAEATWQIEAVAAPTTAPADPTSCDAPRSRSDRPGQEDGYVVHPVYAVPRGWPDRRLEPLIAQSLEIASDWFSKGSEGLRFRLDRCDGIIDVSFVELDATSEEYALAGPWKRDLIERSLRRAGFVAPRTLYLVYYEGAGECGGLGPWPPSVIGTVALVSLRDRTGQECTRQMATDPDGTRMELIAVHEILHTLGIVGTCASHSDGSGHVTGPEDDLMLPERAIDDQARLDPGNDDYLRNDIPDCPDVARSVFLAPTPSDPQVPPGWPEP